MKQKISLPRRNLAGSPGRTAVLVLLTALLTMTVLGGTLIVSGLRKGLRSLEGRLGADVMVVPYEATTQSKLEDIVLQGSTGYFYMDRKLCDKITAREGVGQVSVQLFLASTSSGCCSIPVQIIGFDPETDFTVSPWIRQKRSEPLGAGDIVVGNDLNAFVGDTLTFYGVECHVAAKLDKTGTRFDTAVFTNLDTIRMLIQSSIDRKMNDFQKLNPDGVVSCVLINPADGYSAEEVVNDINLHVKKVRAIRTKEMISGVSDSLSGIASVTGILIAAVWVLVIIILLLVFTMSVNERKREFAVLRVIGASRGAAARCVLQEALTVGLLGGAAGIGIGLLVVLPFNSLIEETLGLPFLLPGGGRIALLSGAALLLAAIVSAAASALSAYRISRLDPAVILRGDAS
ncbi:MAG: FtsX-like permease family protein [Oscillospiraceae bacterium]|nr:FtsX-like permease family protein [Oscillospiraceae bacterium]